MTMPKKLLSAPDRRVFFFLRVSLKTVSNMGRPLIWQLCSFLSLSLTLFLTHTLALSRDTFSESEKKNWATLKTVSLIQDVGADTDVDDADADKSQYRIGSAVGDNFFIQPLWTDLLTQAISALRHCSC